MHLVASISTKYDQGRAYSRHTEKRNSEVNSHLSLPLSKQRFAARASRLVAFSSYYVFASHNHRGLRELSGPLHNLMAELYGATQIHRDCPFIARVQETVRLQLCDCFTSFRRPNLPLSNSNDPGRCSQHVGQLSERTAFFAPIIIYANSPDHSRNCSLRCSATSQRSYCTPVRL